jgi:DNA invertase Pin-like site-specific DNA recombinase
MPTIRAVAYYRKSNDDDGQSIDQQREWAVATAGRDDARLLREFADQSVAGWDNANRSDYHQMLVYCQEQHALGNPVDAVYAWHTNRLSRADSIETNHYLHEFRKAGVSRIRTRERWYDLARKEDRALLNLEQDFTNRQYSIDLAAASLRGRLKFLRDEGRPQGGPVPYAYRAEKEEASGKNGRKYTRTKRLIVGPDAEVGVVRGIFEDYATGENGLRLIAEALNLRGTPAPRGGLWNHQTIRRILTDEVYLGRTVWNRQQRGQFFGVVRLEVHEIKPGKKRRTPKEEWVRKEGTHEPIVTQGLFDRCAAVLARHNKERNPGTGDFPLSGRIRCGHCGSAMTGRNVRFVRRGVACHYRRYECAGYMTHGKAKCHFGCIDADDLADAVMNKLLPPWLDENRDELRGEILRQDRKQAGDGEKEKADGLAKKVERLEREITRATAELVETDSEAQIKRLRAAIKAKGHEQEEAQEALRALEGRKALSGPEDAVDEALALLDALRQARESGDRKAQKGVMHEAVTRIEVFFNREQRGERTRSTFAQALVWLPPDLWAVLTSGVERISTGS